MASFNYIPDAGASRSVKPRVNRTTFGDGYSQRSAMGVNAQEETWSLSFTLKRKSEIQAIDLFLSSQGGTSAFSWTTPNGDTLLFTCSEWSTSYRTDYDCDLSCKLEQVYG
jgi:phage-related protein